MYRVRSEQTVVGRAEASEGRKEIRKLMSRVDRWVIRHGASVCACIIGWELYGLLDAVGEGEWASAAIAVCCLSIWYWNFREARHGLLDG